MSSVNLKRQKKLNSQMNEVMDEFDRFEYFFAKQWKKIVAVALLAVVAVGIYAGITSYEKRQAEKSAQAYSNAQTLEELEAAAAQYKNPPAWVKIKMASLYVEKKDLDKAAVMLTEAAADPAVPEFQWHAMLNLAKVKEMQGKYKEAAAEALKVAAVRIPGSSVFALEGYIAAARNYALAGDKANAQKAITDAQQLLNSLPQDQRKTMENYVFYLNVMSAELGVAAAK